MLELFLSFFTSEEKVQAMLAYPIIRLIFFALLFGFFITIFIHLLLYFRLKGLKDYIKSTKRLDIEPVQTMAHQYNDQQQDNIPLETFIQEQFSKWKFFQIPVVSLIKIIRATISIFILLGVLGTFIGLTIALGAIQTEGEELLEHVVQVLSGIDVAFYTSILGMSASLIVTLLTRIFNTEYVLTDLMLSVESILAVQKKQGLGQLIRVTEEVKQSIDHLQKTNEQSLEEVVSSFTGFKDYTSGLQQAAKDLSLFNEGLTENLTQFQTLFQQMEKNTNTFQKGTDLMNENFTSLINYFKGVDDRNEYISTRLEQTFVNVEKTLGSQEEIAEKIVTTVENMQKFSSSLLENHRRMKRELTSINQSLGEISETIKGHSGEFKRLFGEDVSKRLENIGQSINDLAKQFDRLDESLFYLPDALQEVSNAYVSHQQLMDGRYHEMKRFNETFHEHLREHKIESVTFEQQMKQASTSFDHIGRENQQLLQAIERTIGQFHNSFYEKEQVLEQAITRLQQMMQQLLERVEYSLGDQLQQVGTQMNQTMMQMVNQMSQDLGQIQRLHEQLLQEQTRTFQQMMQTLAGNLQSLDQQRNQLTNHEQSIHQVIRHDR